MLILQRYYFESESQPYQSIINRLSCCCLSYKDTILKANHSRIVPGYQTNGAVAYPTKILFWKRITAYSKSSIATGWLLLILQRYYFESESQLISLKLRIFAAVAYPTKILFWKRITAQMCRWTAKAELLLILQRYYFESESQQSLPYSNPPYCCCLSYKDTILKANHSLRLGISNGIKLLLILQRYYFESESQPSSS